MTAVMKLMNYSLAATLLMMTYSLSPALARVCTWTVEGQVVDKSGRPAMKTKLRFKARWAGAHPWNTANWPETRTDGQGRFKIRTQRLLDCQRPRDLHVSVKNKGRWTRLALKTRVRGATVQLGQLKASFEPVGLLHKTPTLRKSCANWFHTPSKSCGSDLKRCRGHLEVFRGGRVPYFRTHALGKGSGTATRAVIMIHGHSRASEGYFKSGIRGVARGCGSKKTVIFAPHFKSVYENRDGLPPSDTASERQLHWDGVSEWKRGGLSTETKSKRVSSFQVVDHLVKKLKDRRKWPKLKTIVIAGHSAGGQFVNRYAAGTREAVSDRDMTFLFVVSNPSSYLYFDPERAVDGGRGWSKPDTCARYNRYHYGLDRLNEYMSQSSPKALARRYTRQRVIYFAGSRDTGTSILDTSCKANLQGKHRHQRARVYMRYMDRFHPSNKHRLFEIDVGHSAKDMFTHPVGAAILTGQGV